MSNSNIISPENILQEAGKLQEKLIQIRRYLHQHPGCGFNIDDTYHYVTDTLISLGYTPKKYGKAGIVAICQNESAANTSHPVLLRADMDGLPICEEAAVPFASTNGNMHACGHDMHTAMLLGAAEILMNHRDKLSHPVVLCFQPSEENFEGALDMINSGLLKDTTPKEAYMIHIAVGIPLPTGTCIVCDGGVSAPAADYFDIHIQGKGCHGAMPQLGIDPITVAAHIITALQALPARELAMSEEAALTIGTIHAGNASNVIPDTATMGGTLRTYNEDTRQRLKLRMEEIIRSQATAFGATATLTFPSGCPTLVNDSKLSKQTISLMKELLGPSSAFTKEELAKLSGGTPAKSTGSEDFAYFTHEVPSLMIALTGGTPEDGYLYPQHHPKAVFDESALSAGAAIYALLGAKKETV